jgi:hypothetical protein
MNRRLGNDIHFPFEAVGGGLGESYALPPFECSQDEVEERRAQYVAWAVKKPWSQ